MKKKRHGLKKKTKLLKEKSIISSTIKPEERDWIFNKNDIVPTRKKESYCLVCNKRMSMFNFGKYCYLHKFINILKEDKKEIEKYRKNSIIYRQKQKEKYARIAKARKAL